MEDLEAAEGYGIVLISCVCVPIDGCEVSWQVENLSDIFSNTSSTSSILSTVHSRTFLASVSCNGARRHFGMLFASYARCLFTELLLSYNTCL